MEYDGYCNANSNGIGMRHSTIERSPKWFQIPTKSFGHAYDAGGDYFDYIRMNQKYHKSYSKYCDPPAGN